MYGTMKLYAGHVEEVIAKCEPVLVRHRIPTREFESIFNYKRMVDNTCRTESGHYISSWAIKLETKQLLMVFSEDKTIAIYDISKNKKWSKKVMSKRVDNYMEKIFAELAYSEKVEKKLGKSWFWNRIDFYKKAWVGKVNYYKYFKESPPYFDKKKVVNICDHNVFGDLNGNVEFLEFQGYKLVVEEELKAA